MLHSGIAAPSAAVADPAQPADAGGMAHHGHEGMMDTGSSGGAADDADTGCCEQSQCDCTCTASPAALPRPATAARDWAKSGPIRAPDSREFLPVTIGAPFRPPA